MGSASDNGFKVSATYFFSRGPATGCSCVLATNAPPTAAGSPAGSSELTTILPSRSSGTSSGAGVGGGGGGGGGSVVLPWASDRLVLHASRHVSLSVPVVPKGCGPLYALTFFIHGADDAF